MLLAFRVVVAAGNDSPCRGLRLDPRRNGERVAIIEYGAICARVEERLAVELPRRVLPGSASSRGKCSLQRRAGGSTATRLLACATSRSHFDCAFADLRLQLLPLLLHTCGDLRVESESASACCSGDGALITGSSLPKFHTKPRSGTLLKNAKSE